MKITRENIFTFLNAHLLVVILLAITNIVLLTRLVLAWNTLRTDSAEQIQESKTSLKMLELQTAPLRGLPAKVDTAEKQASNFYAARFPSNYSSITNEMFTLAQNEHVRVARVSYTPVPVLQGVEEVRMDASLAGEYAPIMKFINGLERDKLFFLIGGLTLTGQQGGNVNVRLRLITYIHASDADKQPPPPDVGGDENGAPQAAAIPPSSGGY